MKGIRAGVSHPTVLHSKIHATWNANFGGNSRRKKCDVLNQSLTSQVEIILIAAISISFFISECLYFL